MHNQESAKARARRRFERRQTINAPPEAVFPLLCPVREYDWIPEWDCRLVHTESGLAEPGCIFQTEREAEDGLDTWVISRHEPNDRIAFVRMNHLRVMQYEILIERAGEDSSLLVWTQLITALSEEGDRHVEALREADFAQVITKLEALLNDYLSRQLPEQAQVMRS